MATEKGDRFDLFFNQLFGKPAAGEEGSAALPTTVTQPDLTTKEAKALGVREVMSTFTTTFNSGDVPRVHNISLIAAAVHG